MALVSSCIVADPPQYENTLQTAPVLNAYLANPPTTQVLVVKSLQTVSISVPIRSEDAGEELFAYFFLDYGTGKTQLQLSFQIIPPSTFADTGRVVPFTWPVELQPDTTGTPPQTCHTLSLVVAHHSSFPDNDPSSLDPQKAKVDAAIVTWYVSANAPADALNTLVGCPTQRVPAQ